MSVLFTDDPRPYNLWFKQAFNSGKLEKLKGIVLKRSTCSSLSFQRSSIEDDLSPECCIKYLQKDVYHPNVYLPVRFSIWKY